ncbi:hypothetical protein, partial [Bacteroides uniformis]|uniref:hypothetical protein n=1 Tax=Bacteroides uniformis TaxID=820 RepID=UPI0039B378A1
FFFHKKTVLAKLIFYSLLTQFKLHLRASAMICVALFIQQEPDFVILKKESILNLDTLPLLFI